MVLYALWKIVEEPKLLRFFLALAAPKLATSLLCSMANKNKLARGRPATATNNENPAEPNDASMISDSPATTPAPTDSDMFEPSEADASSGLSTPTSIWTSTGQLALI